MKTVTIIGLGPRGLTMLERLLEHAKTLPSSTHLHVAMVDPGSCGEGCHPANQPDHLLVNTVASQITMFAANSVAAGEAGLSLTAWCRSEGYRRYGRQFLCLEDSIGVAITDGDHLPRKLLGSYLSWFFDRVVSKLPRNITVRHHRTIAMDVEEVQDGFKTHLADGSTLASDFLILTTGHGRRSPCADDLAATEFASENLLRNRTLAFFASPYPIERLSAIPSNATVGIQGLGLTAHDVISALTIGRGGKYTQKDGSLTYHPSGREPQIRLFSRSCLPFAARGINQKGLTGKHQAQFFTPAAVNEIRERTLRETGDSRIDFEKQCLPLVVKEMAYAYRSALEQRSIDPGSFELTDAEASEIERVLWPLRGRKFRTAGEFKQFFTNWVKDDLRHAEMGNLVSPIKAATDVLRDAREALRTAVEYAGLTPGSHRFFAEEFNAITNRISFGPPLRRNRETLALLDSGVLRVGGGPGARVVLNSQSAQFEVETSYAEEVVREPIDVLVAARLDNYSPLTDSSALGANLLRRGLVRPFMIGDYHPGGIEIDKRLRPITKSGSASGRMWAAGFLVEGPHFYTHALPRPGMASRQTMDAEVCVLQLIELAAEPAPSTRVVNSQPEVA